ncbi:MAG: TIGR03960 family B12-binding radical SAM protein, partial [Clostridia bacterium]|nr:TIGR03960 family B12-binding radical SAM protein [Clostridia bacterium]
PCASNPEPLAPFVDMFLIGDGEEILPQILELIKDHKRANEGKPERNKILANALDFEGVYVPGLYNFEYHSNGTVKNKSVYSPAPTKIVTNVVKDLDESYFPERPIVPGLNVIHDRMMLEVSRGCSRGCRFCQAGAIYRPVRERSPEVLVRQAENLVNNCGHSEISLSSLSTADYSHIGELATGLASKLSPRNTSISLPSLRVDRFSVDLAQEIQKIRKSTLTFAPEAGTQRLRDVINKGVTEENIMDAASSAFKAGWDRLKLYFMIGLPTETEEDLQGIVELAQKILHMGREIRSPSGRGRVKLTVSASSFVPKPHTPFQWVGQDTVDVLKQKQDYLRGKLGRGIQFSWHDAGQSSIEAAISKGNRNLADVIEGAWSKGCKFDGWDEHFNLEIWQETFKELEYDPSPYTNVGLDLDAVLPWDHLNIGVKKEYLKKEYHRAFKGKLTPDCRWAHCTQCGICSNLKVSKNIKGGGGFVD